MVSPTGAYKVLLEGDSDNNDLTIKILFCMLGKGECLNAFWFRQISVGFASLFEF